MSAFAGGSVEGSIHGNEGNLVTVNGVTIPKSSISEDVKAAGASIGVDVEAIKNKYLSKKLVQSLSTNTSEESLKVKQQLEDAERMRRMEADFEGSRGANVNGKNSAINSANATASASTGSNSNDATSDNKPTEATKRLDRLVICNICHGQGIVKVQYNFQTRDQNCERCEAEGLMWRDDRGILIPQSKAPKVENKHYSQMNEADARELAENCGRSDNFEEPPPLM